MFDHKRVFIAASASAVLIGLVPVAHAGGTAGSGQISGFTITGCDLTATYSWSGFHGGNLTARIVMLNSTTLTGFGSSPFSGLNGKSGSVTLDWRLSAADLTSLGTSISVEGVLVSSSKGILNDTGTGFPAQDASGCTPV